MPQAPEKSKKKILKGLKIFCDIRKCVACKACEVACAVEHSESKELSKAMKETPHPKKRRRMAGSYGRTLSVGCQHCEDAPCVEACMSGCLSKDESGATVQDRKRCVGCWMCIMACPFGAIGRRIEDHVAVKCDLCPDREDFACVSACHAHALFAGTLDEFKKKINPALSGTEQAPGRKSGVKKV